MRARRWAYASVSGRARWAGLGGTGGSGTWTGSSPSAWGGGAGGGGEPFPPARSTSAVLLGFASSSAARKKSTSFAGVIFLRQDIVWGAWGDDEGKERVSEGEIAVWKKTSVSGATGRGA